MQYRARILDHSSLGNSFRRYHRSYKCHLCRNLAVHIRHRMSAGSYPGRDKKGNFAVCLHQFPLVGTSISAQIWSVHPQSPSQPFLSRHATLKVAEHSFGSLWLYVIAKSWQEKSCSSQAETWQMKTILMKHFDWQGKFDAFMVSMATWTIEYNLKISLLLSLHKIHSLDFPINLHTAYDN